MKSLALLSLPALVLGHATFQDLWVGSTDEQGYCVRQPPSNNPVTDTTSDDIRCNVNGATGVAHKCSVAAGDMVTVEMHQQPGDRDCSTQAIGGDHYGPVSAWLSKVEDATTADGSTGWFKIYEDSWAAAPGASSGSSDYWGTNDMNNCCGRVDVKIPAAIPAGDYLLRAEVIALHVASSVGGAQFYMSCYQLSITGGGSASPALVDFPGAYSAQDPGILIDIYESMSTYVVPGPTVYSGGMTKSAGATCSAGVEAATATGAPYSGGSASAVAAPTSSAASTGSTGMHTTTKPTSSASASATPTGGSSACSVTKYGQCGGSGWTGCGTCESGSTCSGVSPPYYSQCV